MKNYLVLGLTLLSALLVLLLASGCEFVHGTFDYDGVSYSNRNGVLYVDDVPLRFERWVKLEQPIPAGSKVTMGTSTEAITLAGAASPEAAALEVHLFSEVQNDGTVALESGKLTARSDTAHKVAINGVRGTVPASVSLAIETGTADVSLSALAGTSTLKIGTGTGDVKLDACKVASVSIETGTGDMALGDVQATTIGIKTGTGDSRLKACTADELKFESGTGDLRLDGCQFKQSRLDSGTGDIRLMRGSSLGAESHDLGTGDIKETKGDGE